MGIGDCLISGFFEEQLGFDLRDYVAEIEATIVAKLPTWKPQHLSLWTDLVEPPATPCKVATAADVAEMEDEAQGAKFREVCAKIRQDMATMTAYNAQVAENKKREHVVLVMHEKSQMQQGKEFLGKNKVLFAMFATAFFNKKRTQNIKNYSYRLMFDLFMVG